MHSSPEEVHNSTNNNGAAAGAVAAADGVGDGGTGGPASEPFYDELEDPTGTRQTLIQVSACVVVLVVLVVFSSVLAKRSKGLFGVSSPSVIG